MSACSEKGSNYDPKLSTEEMIEQLTKQYEQPPQTDLETDGVKNLYHLDPALLDTYTIKIPLMNVKTNEIAVLKAKNAKDVEAIQEGVKQRAAEVQKQFETYLPDQYENAKNYKVVAQGSYVLFVIGENADDIVTAFNGFFETK
nr:DUF4358 domain-containing protein [Paenibacillus lupini]